MRALVTGAAGFLGRHLVATLHHEGFAVRVLVKASSDRRDWGCEVDRQVGNVLDRDAVRAAVADVRVVFHCAAALPGANISAAEIDQVNIVGTQNLIDGCLVNGRPRLVFVSTDSVYGDGDHRCASEETPVNPDYFTEGNYPSSKLAAERVVMTAYAAGLPVSIVRPCLMYGPGSSPGSDILRAWARKKVHLLIDNGLARLSLLFVEDAAAAIMLAGIRAEAIGQHYNVSDGASYSRREILDALSRVTGVRKRYVTISSHTAEIVFRMLRLDGRRVAFAANSHVIDSSKIQRELGFSPRTSLDSGLERMAWWLRDPQRAPW
jgi:nucleoside-diphosphate-sugar epimerase